MKLKTKLLTAAAGIVACAALATSISAYRDLGDTLSYYVRSDIPDWSNRESKFAWIIQNDRHSNFKYSVVNDGSFATFKIKRWTIFNDDLKGVWYFQPKGEYTYSIYTEADDYYATVRYDAGDYVLGNVQLSR